MKLNRPHVLVNVAMSADGKIDCVERGGASISSATDMERVDRLRAQVDGVIVGGHTLIEGDPRLTVKSPTLRADRIARGLAENPAKIGIVSVANVRPDSRFMSFTPARRIIYTTQRTPPQQIAILQAAGAEIFILGEQRVDLTEMLGSLYDLGMRSLLVEGGGILIAAFFQLSLVDELSFYIAPRIFGGSTAPTPTDGAGFLPEQSPRLQLVSVDKFDEEGGILVHYTIDKKE